MTSLFVRDAVDAFDLKNRGKGCTAYNPAAKHPTYGYVPNLAAGIVYSIVFGLTMIAHFAQVFKYRKWWYLAIPIGALCEVMGWCARAAAHHCPYSSTLFSLQISILIIAPCFYSAGIYYILGEMLRQYGRQFSPISPRTYLLIFVGFDIISIAIQGTGGGLASSAGSKVPPGDTGPGTHTMMGGIIIQLVSMSAFSFLWLWFVWTARRTNYSKVLAVTTTINAALILIRNFYRAVELSQGWDGHLITTEPFFDILDAMLMALVPIIWNVFHPARYVTGIPDPATLGAKGQGYEYGNGLETVNGAKDPKIVNIVDQISQLTLLETADLVSTLKTRLNIPDAPLASFATGPSSGGAPAAAAPAEEEDDGAAAAPAEKTLFTLTLKSIEAGSKPKIIKEVKSMLGLSLVDSKKFVESAPKTMKEGVPKEEAEKIIETLKAIGGTVTMD